MVAVVMDSVYVQMIAGATVAGLDQDVQMVPILYYMHKFIFHLQSCALDMNSR